MAECQDPDLDSDSMPRDEAGERLTDFFYRIVIPTNEALMAGIVARVLVRAALPIVEGILKKHPGAWLRELAAESDTGAFRERSLQ